MSCLINLVGIPLIVGLTGYFIFYLIRQQIARRDHARAQVQAKFNHTHTEPNQVPDLLAKTPLDSKFYDGGR